MARFEMPGENPSAGSSAGTSAEALFQLGLMYASGRDVDADLVMAHKWFNLAALRGKAEARAYRMEIAEELSSSEVAQAQRLAREWLKAH